MGAGTGGASLLFQSTYLYKVRRFFGVKAGRSVWFQSTYLYKVRQYLKSRVEIFKKFQSTYLYKVRHDAGVFSRCLQEFQSTYLYKVRLRHSDRRSLRGSFNPRTYIRYDCITNNANIYSLLSMPLCDNKLFGFFIDEIKLIGVFNRLIINDCETSSFLLMLTVRKQLYYKFVFYIIGCDDAYVFNSFRIIIPQKIETDTIFFMIDDIQ